MIFKESSKVSVHEYINRKRLDKAVFYLCNQDLSIQEIIEIIGYENETNFYRLFKKFYGVTPNEYRINHCLNKQ
jgi:AraC-like DNA-binding protein